MKKIYLLFIIVLLFNSCLENSTDPVSEDGTYNFSMTAEESFTVYGKGGEIINESEWDESIELFVSRANAEMENEYGYMEDYSFELKDGELISYDGTNQMTADYKIKNDTIYFYVDFGTNETFEIPFGLVKDDKTIEMQVYSFGYHSEFYSEYSSGNDFGGYDNGLPEVIADFETMGDDEYITVFFKRLHYVKE